MTRSPFFRLRSAKSTALAFRMPLRRFSLFPIGISPGIGCRYRKPPDALIRAERFDIGIGA
jgi:hypothetical protein